jgi:hypothetical protein
MPLLAPRRAATMVGLAGLVAAGGLRLTADAPHAGAPGGRTVVVSPRDLVEQYCLDCHDNSSKKADLSLEAIMGGDLSAHAVVWEKVVKKLRTRQMPPLGEPRPDEATYEAIVA